MKNTLTLTIVAKMTANYGESLGNIGNVQKNYRNGNTYAMRSKESMKYAIMKTSGLYDDLEIELDKVAQKEVSKEKDATTVRALEGGYMNTGVVVTDKNKGTYIRNSSFYLTDAVSCEPLIIDARFHNNLNMAQTFAEANGLNVQRDAKAVGLNPFQYEYDNNLKKYSITIDLEMIGRDDNFENPDASKEEKVKRVEMILEAIEHLSLVVRGNLDNAEPIFIVGGLSKYKTHLFDNLVNVKQNKLIITETLTDRIEDGFKVGLLGGDILDNESEIEDKMSPTSVSKFFKQLKEEIKEYYGE